MASLARATDELIARNAVCAARDDPLNSLRRGGRCGQTGQQGTFEFKLTCTRTDRYIRPSCSRPSFEGPFNHHYTKPAHIPTPDLWHRRRRRSSTKGSKLFTTSCQNVSNHPSYSYRTSLVRHSVPTFTVLVDSMVAQEAVGHFMLLPLRARRLKGSRW